MYQFQCFALVLLSSAASEIKSYSLTALNTVNYRLACDVLGIQQTLESFFMEVVRKILIIQHKKPFD